MKVAPESKCCFKEDLTVFVDSQAFFQNLYKGIDDLDGLERRMIRMEELFSKQAAAAFFAERLEK